MPPLTEAQLEVRKTGLGSSDISAVCGENPFKSRHGVWLDKMGLAEPVEETDAIWLGRELEPVLAKRYERETGIRVVPGPGTQRHREHDWLLATTDYEHADGSALCEMKVVGWRCEHHWDDSRDDGIPDYVRLQVTEQMAVRGIHRFAVPVLFTSDARFRIFVADFDPRLFAGIVEVTRRFWFDHVLPGVPPPVDGSDDARTMLATLYPRPTRALIPAPPGSYDAAIAYEDARRAKKVAEADLSLAGNRLREKIGDAEGIEAEWGKVLWAANAKGVRSLRVTLKERDAA